MNFNNLLIISIEIMTYKIIINIFIFKEYYVQILQNIYGIKQNKISIFRILKSKAHIMNSVQFL